MREKTKLTKELVRYLFSYNTVNGELTWKVPPSYKIKSGAVAGSNHTDGYKHTMYKGKNYLNHRIVWVYHNGELTDETLIDHINNVRDDNRIENLQLATKQENCQKQKKQTDVSSLFLGVSWHKRDMCWQSYYSNVNGKRVNLGYFDNELRAAIVAEYHQREVKGVFFSEDTSVENIILKLKQEYIEQLINKEKE